MTLSDLKTEL